MSKDPIILELQKSEQCRKCARSECKINKPDHEPCLGFKEKEVE